MAWRSSWRSVVHVGGGEHVPRRRQRSSASVGVSHAKCGPSRARSRAALPGLLASWSGTRRSGESRSPESPNGRFGQYCSTWTRTFVLHQLADRGTYCIAIASRRGAPKRAPGSGTRRRARPRIGVARRGRPPGKTNAPAMNATRSLRRTRSTSKAAAVPWRTTTTVAAGRLCGCGVCSMRVLTPGRTPPRPSTWSVWGKCQRPAAASSHSRRARSRRVAQGQSFRVARDVDDAAGLEAADAVQHRVRTSLPGRIPARPPRTSPAEGGAWRPRRARPPAALSPPAPVQAEIRLRCLLHGAPVLFHGDDPCAVTARGTVNNPPPL